MITMLGGGCRISQQLRDCNHYNYHHHHHHQSLVLGLGLGLGLCSSRIVYLSTFMERPPPFMKIGDNHRRLQPRLISSSSLQCKSPGEIPILPDCFSQQEDDHDHPAKRLSSVAGGIVALGKFDALHVGHRELAIQASKVGAPFLLSFVGMAEVLGWEPRAPIVAKCDRQRVLSSWAPYCGNVAPAEFEIQFSNVRKLTPRQFVEKLSNELKVRGVVAGENYRFGFKAAGDASELVRLCDEYGITAYIIDSVMDKNRDFRDTCQSDLKDRGQVSSTRVRHALSVGDTDYVSKLLGRPHRLTIMVNDYERLSTDSREFRISVPKSCLLNLLPRDGFYQKCSFLYGDSENRVTCSVFIDATHIHLELDELGFCNFENSHDFRPVGIEFN